MKLEVLKKRLGVNSRQIRELIKSCGFTDVRNYGESHLKTMSEYADKIGMKIYDNPIEEDEIKDNGESCPDDMCDLEEQLESSGFLKTEKQLRVEETKELFEKRKICITPGVYPVDIKVRRGDLIHILSKAYDIGYAAGKNIEPESINSLSEILSAVVDGKAVAK